MQRLSNSDLQNFLGTYENRSIDFKRDQYKFINATNEEKSELLKDILAFANSQRENEAYIFIGVEDIKGGGKNKVVGIEVDKRFDDANLQQFIKDKTNRKIIFLYEEYELEDKNIGIIRIPKQERPFFAIKDFGKVKKNTVYHRSGSSTVEANPQEIYEMHKNDNQKIPTLDLQFVNINSHEKLGKEIKISIICFAEPKIELPDYIEYKDFGRGVEKNPLCNINYLRELEHYVRSDFLLKPIQLSVFNSSNYHAENVDLAIKIKPDNFNNIVIKELKDVPKKTPPASFCIPEKLDDIEERLKFLEKSQQKRIYIEGFDSSYNLSMRIGYIPPQSQSYTEIFYIGSKETAKIELQAKIYAHNLPNPKEFNLAINFNVEQRPSLTIKNL